MIEAKFITSRCIVLIENQKKKIAEAQRTSNARFEAFLK